MRKKTCHVMVGLPATGKSTLVRTLLHTNMNAFVYSTDDFIEGRAALLGKTYNEVFRDTIDEATREMNERLRLAISDEKDVIWDQTNLTKKKRKSIIDQMKREGYFIKCHCIVKPEATHIADQVTWKNRLDSRPQKKIPAHVLMNMIEGYQEPTLEEGFDVLICRNMYSQILDQ